MDHPTRHDQHGRWPQAESVEDFRHNLAIVQAHIAAACQRVGRDPAAVRLLPVSKTKPESSLRLAYAAGCRMLGENKPQEAYGNGRQCRICPICSGRLSATCKPTRPSWWRVLRPSSRRWTACVCGPRRWSGACRWKGPAWMSLCKSTLRAGEQVWPAAEEAAAFIKALPAFSALRVRGLMTLALFSAEAAQVRQCFVRLRGLRDQLRQEEPAWYRPGRVVDGMSGTTKWRWRKVATVVRVGQAIFGARAMPDSHYWPVAGDAVA
ncbi:alanine racemase [Comamonas sp. JC664]|uniref:alanine racemase n=1 Tax=Comamonas sp. JC664 TaxID=2801917 RepID=UPI00360A8C2F